MPGSIRWTAVDSGFGMRGSYVVWRIELAEGGGSRHLITWDRRGETDFGKGRQWVDAISMSVLATDPR